jgi:acyl carrier protein
MKHFLYNTGEHIKAGLKYGATEERIAQDLVEEYGIDSTEALQWIKEIKSETEIA